MTWRSTLSPPLRTLVLRRGSRTVLVTYPGLRFGNYLYFALHAYIAVGAGRDYRVLDTGLDHSWYALFPAFRGLMVDRLGLRDRRDYIPELFYQHYGQDFDYEDVRQFVTRILNPPQLPSYEGSTVTVNVRRGDYYESPQRRSEFGFDIRHYLGAALDQACAHELVEDVRIVSDDPDWAVDAMAKVRPELAIREVVSGGAQDHFLALTRSPRLVLANSTFSYWGAYVSMIRHAPSPISVYAPDLSVRSKMGGKAWQLAPSWRAIATRPYDECD